MEELAVRLNKIEDSYYDFVVAVLNYINKKQSRKEKIDYFMNNNPEALTSDILEFISRQDDFYEDAAYVQMEVG